MKSKITPEELLPLIGMSICAFIFNTSEFMPMGLLTSIGETFSTSEAETGQMISVYAWFVMIMSMPFMVFGTRFNFRKLVLGIITIFIAGQFLSAIAPNFILLCLARLVVATAHCIFWAILVPLSVRLVRPELAAFAVSLAEAGAALATVLGLPIGRTIGLIMSWRASFMLVGIVMLVLLVYMFFVMPKIPNEDKFSFKDLPCLLKNKALLGIFAITMCYSLGFYVTNSYIEPYLLQIGGLPASAVTIFLSLFGVAGLASSIFFTKKYKSFRFKIFIGSLLGVSTCLLSLIITVKMIPVLVIAFLIWGFCGTLFAMASQTEIVNVCKPEDQTVAMAIFSGLFNFGIGTGAFIGGIVIDNLSIDYVGLFGGVIVTIGAVLAISKIVPMLKKYKAL